MKRGKKEIVVLLALFILVSLVIIVFAATPSNIDARRADVAVVKTTIWNATSVSALGASMASADLNKDGYDDIVMSAMYKNLSGGARDNSGQVYVFYGYPGGYVSGNVTNANVTINGTYQSSLGSTQTSFGSVIHIDDFNNDTYPDLVVGARYSNLSGSADTNTGQVFIFYGSADGLHPYTSDQANVTFNGTSPGYFASRGGLASGDFNNDSYNDLAISAYAKNLSGGVADNTGQVYIFYGSADGLHSYSTAQANATFNGTSAGGYFGWSLAAGDFNNDLFTDLAVGAYYKNSTAGQVNIFYGGNGGMHSYTSDQANVTINGTAPQYFGQSLRADDLNQDGLTDLAVGGPYTVVDGISIVGKVFIFYNKILNSCIADTCANITLNGTRQGQFGWSIWSEDINRDNITDLMVGANQKNNSGGTGDFTGQEAIFYGTQNGFLPYSAADANITLNGTNDYDGVGFYFVSGDYNGDNVTELIGGAPYVNLSGPSGNAWEGQVYVYTFNFPPTSSTIPNRGWNEDSSITINLSAYFTDVNRDNLNYTWSGNSNIAVSIDEAINIVTLTPNANWYGTEYITFYANDSYNDLVASNNITLTVSNTADCGDATCDSSESCTSCASDCGACPAVSGSSTAAAEQKAAHTFTTITPESPATADFKNIAVSSITLTTDETANNVRLEVKEVSQIDVPMPETGVYKLIDIKASNIELKEAKIKFKVKLSWLKENEVEQGEVVLMHHKDSWKKLKTAYTGKDDENAYYEAKTGSLSMFAISYQKKEVEEEPIQEEPEEEKAEIPPEPAMPVKEKSVFLPILSVIGIIALIVIAIILIKRKH